ncbi:MAG: hypothetical protein Q8L86_01955 [Vicinamibacterales bacterium]|nr:hypothetical protein [Vicinamibacterales bacterium]
MDRLGIQGGDTPAELAGLEARRLETGYVDAFLLASAYAEIGDAARAFAWLDEAITDRSAYVPMLVVDPVWTHFHADARFLRRVEQVGLISVLARVSGQRAE